MQHKPAGEPKKTSAHEDAADEDRVNQVNQHARDDQSVLFILVTQPQPGGRKNGQQGDRVNCQRISIIVHPMHDQAGNGDVRIDLCVCRIWEGEAVIKKGE